MLCINVYSSAVITGFFIDIFRDCSTVHVEIACIFDTTIVIGNHTIIHEKASNITNTCAGIFTYVLNNSLFLTVRKGKLASYVNNSIIGRKTARTFNFAGNFVSIQA